MENKNIILFVIGLIFIASPSLASANLVLDGIQFDPAIVSAGDTVDIVVQFHYETSSFDDYVGNPDYDFKVELESDSSLVDDYVTILDRKGDGYNKIYSDVHYNQVYRVKISNAAPTGDYEFKLSGQWFEKSIPKSAKEEMEFILPVKKEGISMNLGAVNTQPAEVRSGDDFVRINAFVENSGDKNSKDVELQLILPEGISPSYSNNNRVWVGNVNSQESKPVVFYVDVDDKVQGGIYNFSYKIKYKDLESNSYESEKIIPFYIKSSPQIEVFSVKGSAIKGTSSKMYVTLKNVGNETAESVDVRLLKQSSQPFSFDARSDYVGELKPGEESTAVFNLKVDSSAESKEHDFKLLIRAKGDSDDGDDNIYIFSRRAKFEVKNRLVNPLVLFGLFGVLGVFTYMKKKELIANKIRGMKK